MDRSDRSIDHRVIFTGRDSTCMGHARITRARARESSRVSIRQGMRSYSMRLSLSLYTNPTHTHHARGSSSSLSRSRSLSSHDSWMSPRVSRPPARRRGPAHADARLPHDARTHHDCRRRRHDHDDESDVLLFARLSRRVDHREQRCRSEAGASDARENERAAGRMECARAGWRGGGGGARRSRARGTARARGMTTRNDGCGEIIFFLNVSRGSRRERARGDVDGGRGRRIDRAIATGPAYPREGW